MFAGLALLLLVVLIAIGSGNAQPSGGSPKGVDPGVQAASRNTGNGLASLKTIDGTQQFFAGRWAATRGKWRVRYTENELCVMTAGRVTITSDSGERASFGPGDAFVVPAGFAGTWEVLEDCAKIYAIFEPTHS